MRSRTSDHFSPPRPHPSGGTATECLTFKRRSEARYRLNRWRDAQLTRGVHITYRDLVKEYVRLNRPETTHRRAPSGRYINFLSDFMAAHPGTPIGDRHSRLENREDHGLAEELPRLRSDSRLAANETACSLISKIALTALAADGARCDHDGAAGAEPRLI